MTTATVTDMNPLAVSLAEAAIHGGVAAHVIRLLTGGGMGAETTESIEEGPWAGSVEAFEFSAPTKTENEDDGELSKLLKMVRERRTSPRRRRKPASS